MQEGKDWAFDESMSTFFRMTDERHGAATGTRLRLRTVLVDTEEGVLAQLLRGPLGRFVDPATQVLADVSGAGNNWYVSCCCFVHVARGGVQLRLCDLRVRRAHGFYEYGSKYRPRVMELVRRNLEVADSPQAFLLLHSLGGGTGSGLGTSILEGLAEEFPGIDKIATSVFPSDKGEDDVVTSPYNSGFAVRSLATAADVVLPIENERLAAMADVALAKARRAGAGAGDGGAAAGGGGRARVDKATAFDSMNAAAGHVLTSLTASTRFEGSLNVDLNEIATNLVPFPRLHFLAPSIAPLSLLAHGAGASGAGAAAARGGARSIAQSFTDCFEPDYQLCSVQPKRHTVLACALLARGRGVGVSDLQRALEKLRPTLRMPLWNQDGFKTGLCQVAPPGADHAVLGLCNSAGYGRVFESMHNRFVRLWSVGAHVHHYTEYGMDRAEFEDAADQLRTLAADYKDFDALPSDDDDHSADAAASIDSVIDSLLGLGPPPR